MAIKQLFTSRSLDNHLRDQLLAEINILAVVRHPNCVMFIGAVLEDVHFCVVTEFCSRGSVYSVLHDSGKVVDWPLRLKILTDTALGSECCDARACPRACRCFDARRQLV